jgi:hypothetical protein
VTAPPLDAQIRAKLDELNPAERRLAQLRLDRILRRKKALQEFPSPGHLARFVQPDTVQTDMMVALDKVIISADAGFQRRWIISTPPQEGKSLALDTPIATPSGWTTMGEIKIGDQVFDRYGKPCTVTYVSPIRTDRDCYAVTTGDGERIIADREHLWIAKLDRRWGEKVHTTETIANARSKNAQITGPAGLDLPDADLPLDPYVLGAWLGDGHSLSAHITSADPEVLDRIRAAGYPVRPTGNPIVWTLAPVPDRKGKPRGNCSPIRRVLVELGVWGNKHVPDAYLRGSDRQRLALLQGLVDTDGYVSPKGQVEFTNMNRRLAKAVQHLAFTLGAKATLREGRATINGRDCGAKYRVKFYLDRAAYLPRKAAKCRDSSVARVRYVKAERTLTVPVRCIEVDSPSHTYLAGRSLLPTHNTQRMGTAGPLWLLLRDPTRRIIVASYEQGVAARSGLAVRQMIETYGGGYKGDRASRHQDDHLGLLLDPDRAQQTNWNLIDGPGRRNGGMIAVGVGGSLTGRPADVMIIDDSIKNSKQADNPQQRKHIRDWYESVVTTRLSPGAIVIIIGTRWHEDDLIGSLMLKDDLADTPRFRHLIIPAQAKKKDPLGRKPGQYLISTRGRTEGDWLQIRKDVGERFWAALYQAEPSPPAGGVFQLEWINNNRVKAAPELQKIEVFVDPADNEGEGDEAGVIAIGRTADQHYYVLADESDHMTVGRWFRVAILLALRLGATAVRYEKSLSGLKRSARLAWKDILRESRILNELDPYRNMTGRRPLKPAPDVLAAAVARVARDDADAEELVRIERDLIELWPQVPSVLAIPSATGLPIRGFSATGSKTYRAKMVAPLHETGRVHHVGYFMELTHQMVAWQESQDSPDRMDACVHGLDQMSRGSGDTSLSRSRGTVATRPSQAGNVQIDRLGANLRRT